MGLKKNTVNGRVKTIQPPINVPTIGTVTLTNQINVSVTFTPATQNAEGGPNRWYVFRTTTGGVSTDQIVSSSPVVINGLAGNTTYTFSVATANAGGTSAFSASTSPVTTQTPLSIVSGGTLTSDSTYYYRTNATDSWGISVTNFPLVCDILLVGGGGGAGHWESGGGGGGEAAWITNATIPIGGGTFNYGAGGATGGGNGGGAGGDGNRTWLTATAYEGRGGQGGGGVNTSGRSRAGGQSGNLNAGATPGNAPATAGGGGGAGGSAVGLSGNGGIGFTAFNGIAYGGGGMGGNSGNSSNPGGHTAGGGISNGNPGTANRGGGGAGNRDANGAAGGAGGSGWAIVRYLKTRVE
jgi:hypothetical protein